MSASVETVTKKGSDHGAYACKAVRRSKKFVDRDLVQADNINIFLCGDLAYVKLLHRKQVDQSLRRWQRTLNIKRKLSSSKKNWAERLEAFELLTRASGGLMRRGDVYRAVLNPVVGSEQSGTRP